MKGFLSCLKNIGCFLLIWSSLVGTGFAQDGMAWRELPIAQSLVIANDAQKDAETTLQMKPGQYISLELPFAAGTGYQWMVSVQPPSLSVVHEATSSSISEPQLVGGMMRQHYIIQVCEDMSGEATMLFSLRRPWEQLQEGVRNFRLKVIVER